MIATRPMTTAQRLAPRLLVLSVTFVFVAAACSGDSNGGDAAPAPTPAETVAAPADTTAPEAPSTAAPADEPAAEATADAGTGFDFGSGTATVTLGDQVYEFDLEAGSAVCRDVFDMIQASGPAADGRDIRTEMAIPPIDWESFTDGRYDPPSVELRIDEAGDENARWRADAGWADEMGQAGSGVDSYEKDGLHAKGTATFVNDWAVGESEPVPGSFEVRCTEA